MSKRILITLNALKDNRGSEALVRGLVRICKFHSEDCEIIISSGSKGEIQTNIPNVKSMVSRRDDASLSAKLKARFYYRILKNQKKAEEVHYKELIREAKRADAIFVIGADNYDASYNMQGLMQRINTMILKAAKGTTIMYDCSLEDAHLTDEVQADIERFDVITVRESVSKDIFEKKIKNAKVKYYPDPAFAMLPEECELPKGYIEGKMVGINLSNLVASGKYGAHAEKLLESYYNLMNYILEQTQLNIILIPHVMGGADLSVLRTLYSRYEQNERVVLLDNENLNAAQLKYIISKLNYLVTARTHASIAAYSTCVPTLVLGYSVKSIGIAVDLFGTTQGYVMSSDKVVTGMELTDNFKWLLTHGDEIKEHLKKHMPAYIDKALKTGEII